MSKQMVKCTRCRDIWVDYHFDENETFEDASAAHDAFLCMTCRTELGSKFSELPKRHGPVVERPVPMRPW
jgi:hypothetical protein